MSREGSNYLPQELATSPIGVQRRTVTVTEAASILGISRSTAYELVRTGGLPSLRLGRRIVVPTHALVDLLGSAQRSELN